MEPGERELERLRQLIRTQRARSREEPSTGHDELTGLPDRNQLVARLEAALAGIDDLNGGVGVFFIDLDDFRSVNERYGRAAGDRLLRDLAAQMRAGMRSGDTLARFGGDEFVLVCEQAHPAVTASVRRRIQSAVAAVAAAGQLSGIRASIGSAWGRVGQTPEELLSAADASMYRVRHQRPERPASGPPPA